MNKSENLIKVNAYFIRSNFNLILAKLCETLLKKKKKILINTSSNKESLELDRFLWTVSEDSFIPHRMVEDPVYIDESILIFSGDYRNVKRLDYFDIIFISPLVIIKRLEFFKNFFLFSIFDEIINIEKCKLKLEKNGFNSKILVEKKNKEWEIF